MKWRGRDGFWGKVFSHFFKGAKQKNHSQQNLKNWKTFSSIGTDKTGRILVLRFGNTSKTIGCVRHGEIAG